MLPLLRKLDHQSPRNIYTLLSRPICQRLSQFRDFVQILGKLPKRLDMPREFFEQNTVAANAAQHFFHHSL
jgi:hypothetical protein